MLQNEISYLQAIPLSIGLASTVKGGSDLAEGNFLEGSLATLGGAAVAALATAGNEETQHQAMKAAAITAAGTAALRGATMAVEESWSGNFWGALKGAGTALVAGAAGVATALMPAKAVAYGQFALTALGTGAGLAYSGAKDVIHGKFGSGVGKVVAGAGALLGGAALATAAYNEIEGVSIGSAAPVPNSISHIFSRRKGTSLAVNFPCNNCGMFVALQYVLGVANAYNPKIHSGLEVDFQNLGLYYDPQKGGNWFNYFFEPIKLGKTGNSIPFSNEELGMLANSVEGMLGSFCGQKGMSRKQANLLIKNYFKLRPELKNEIDQFASDKFKDNYVIGIHYRGTDKVRPPYSEAQRMSYEAMFETVREHAKERNLQQFKIFVASDEQSFVDRIQQEFPGQVIVTPTLRSTNDKALHFDAENKYEMGKGAVKDCWLLARSNFLIRTSSNLSLFSTYLNPDLPTYEVSQRSRYV